MEPTKREEKRRIFRQELFTLKEEGYLSDAIVEVVANAHHQYHLDLLKKESTPVLPKEKDQQKVVEPPPKPKKVKKTLSPEEIRERNISWSLNIGVIFLLIGGLFVATSNWESMTSLMKSGSIAIVALLFYGFALLANKVLKIEKTSFAFTVLGSLFLPIFILSLGWFGLLGPYLSIDGAGRYVLGILGSFIPIVVYVFFAKGLNSRLFVWFTYVSLTAGAAFTFASLKVSIDYFYLGLMAFNGALIVIYHRIKGIEAIKLFTKEFVLYIQINLVLITLFMLFLFDNHVLYSFNLLLTAIIYLSMMFVSGRKEYHFVFTLMVVYGVYQLIENSFLDTTGAIFYALLGFSFVLVPKALVSKFALERVFQYTSAIISGFVFIYISFEGIMLRAGDPSIIMMIAYMIIAGNFIYLSHNNAIRLFPYLSSIFLASAIYEAAAILTNRLDGLNFSFVLYLSGFSLFLLFGIARIHVFLKIIQNSSRDVGIGISIGSIILALQFSLWWELGIMFLMLVLMTYLVSEKDNRYLYREIAKWILPGAIGLSVAAFGEEFRITSGYYANEFGVAVNFAIAAIIVFLTSFGWKKVNKKDLERNTFLLSQVLYTISIVQAIGGPINQLWVKPLLLIIGIGMYYYFYKTIGAKWIPFLVSLTTLLFYFSLVDALSSKITFIPIMNSLILPLSAVVLFAIAYFTRIRDSVLAFAFGWIGHCIFPLSLAFVWFAFHSEAIHSFIISLLVYAVSTFLVEIEWKIKVFLYGSFTSLLFVISKGIDYWFINHIGQYEFILTSISLLIIWFFASEKYKKRIEYYFVPFSIIGIALTIITYPFDWLPYVVTCCYTVITLYFLHRIKWDLLTIIPLLLAFIANAEYSFFSGYSNLGTLLLAGGIGVLLIIAGMLLYNRLFERSVKIQDFKIDWYTISAFCYFLYMYFYYVPQIWASVLPGLLIAVTIWLQQKRVETRYSYLFALAGGIYLLQPYYTFLSDLNVPPLWERELVVLPWVAVTIFAHFKLKGKYSRWTSILQWGVLILVSLLLIQDGLASSTIYNAIILGSLSLISMLVGMYLQIKSYFFVGSGSLLLNVFLQTRPYWGNMPWWAYLLIVGLILITIASMNEWNKQKAAKGESTFITFFKEKVVNKIKKWN